MFTWTNPRSRSPSRPQAFTEAPVTSSLKASVSPAARLPGARVPRYDLCRSGSHRRPRGRLCNADIQRFQQCPVSASVPRHRNRDPDAWNRKRNPPWYPPHPHAELARDSLISLPRAICRESVDHRVHARPVSKMNEKVASGGSFRAAIAAARPAAPVGTPGGGAAPGLPARAAVKKLAGIGGVGPKRPPERLSQPVILCLKKSVRTSRLEVMPPWECPTSQKARMFCLPI